MPLLDFGREWMPVTLRAFHVYSKRDRRDGFRDYLIIVFALIKEPFSAVVIGRCGPRDNDLANDVVPRPIFFERRLQEMNPLLVRLALALVRFADIAFASHQNDIENFG